MSVIEIPIAVFNTDAWPSQRHADIKDDNSLVQFMKKLYDDYLAEIRSSGRNVPRLMTASEIKAPTVKDNLKGQLMFQDYQTNKEVTSFYDFPLFRPDPVINEKRYIGIILSINGHSAYKYVKEMINVLLVSVHMHYKKTEQDRKGELEKLKGKIDEVKCNGQFQVAHVIIAGDFNIGLGTIREVFPYEEYNYATNEKTTAAGNSYDNIITSRSAMIISDVKVRGKNTKVDKYLEFRQIFEELLEISQRVQNNTLAVDLFGTKFADPKENILSQLRANTSNFPHSETCEIQEFESYHEKGMKLCKSFECCKKFQQLFIEILPSLDSYYRNEEEAIDQFKIKLKSWLEQCPSLDSCDKESLPQEIIKGINLCMRLKEERYKFSHFPLFAKLQVLITETPPAQSNEAAGTVTLEKQLTDVTFVTSCLLLKLVDLAIDNKKV